MKCEGCDKSLLFDRDVSGQRFWRKIVEFHSHQIQMRWVCGSPTQDLGMRLSNQLSFSLSSPLNGVFTKGNTSCIVCLQSKSAPFGHKPGQQLCVQSLWWNPRLPHVLQAVWHATRLCQRHTRRVGDGDRSEEQYPLCEIVIQHQPDICSEPEDKLHWQKKSQIYM